MPATECRKKALMKVCTAREEERFSRPEGASSRIQIVRFACWDATEQTVRRRKMCVLPTGTVHLVLQLCFQNASLCFLMESSDEF